MESPIRLDTRTDMNITFFAGKGHNGDMFTSRSYLQHITEHLKDCKLEYYHTNHYKTLLDLNITHQGSKKIGHRGDRFIEKDNKLFVNTWNGVYSKRWYPDREHSFYDEGTNFSQLTETWNYIFNKINEFYGTDLRIEDKHYYVPSINYNVYNISNIDLFLKERTNKKILISNGPVRSAQSFNHDMKNIIEDLATKNANIDFYATCRFQTSLPNIFFTDDIIQDKSGCDLNEISYLSTFCDVIVGKNSGPYIYCLVKENLFNPNKKIIQFNKREHDSLCWDIDIAAKYTYSSNYNDDNIRSVIEDAIK